MLDTPRAFFVVVLAALLIGLFAVAQPARSDTMSVDGLPVVIHYQPADVRVAEKVAEICRKEIPGLSAQLGLVEMTPIEVVAADDMRPYRDALGSNLPVWGVAFAILKEQKIVVDVARATRSYNQLDEVMPHELSHLLLVQRAPGGRFPIWFVEGLAKWQAREWSMVDSWQLMSAVWGKDTPRLSELVGRYPESESRAHAAYRVSYVAFTDMFDDRFERLPAFLDQVNRYGGFEPAFEAFYGTMLPVYMADFDRRLESRYHSRLFVFQSGPLFSIAAALFVLVIVRYTIRKRRKMRELEKFDEEYFG